MFCPKCGALLMPKTVGNKKIIACSCGYKSQDTDILSIKEKKSKIEAGSPVEVVHEKSDAESLPLTKEDCPKCKHPRAFYWLAQTRAGDEPETRFFRCEKCKHTWREYA